MSVADARVARVMPATCVVLVGAPRMRRACSLAQQAATTAEVVVDVVLVHAEGSERPSHRRVHPSKMPVAPG